MVNHGLLEDTTTGMTNMASIFSGIYWLNGSLCLTIFTYTNGGTFLHFLLMFSSDVKQFAGAMG